jgi:diguanylate cyclase (GGDEF)-like protein
VEAERERHRTRVPSPRPAPTDPLTGLPDRRRVGEQVETALWGARTGDTALAVLLVDVDALPMVNGTWGHEAGERLLCTAVDRMRARVRRTDLLGRLGGSEFVVALLGLDAETARAEASRVAAELIEAVRRPIRLGNTQLPIGLRVGVAVHPDDGEDFAALLRAADLGRYERRPAGAP